MNPDPCEHRSLSPSQAVGAWCLKCGTFAQVTHAQEGYKEPYWIDGRLGPNAGFPLPEMVDTGSGQRVKDMQSLVNAVRAALAVRDRQLEEARELLRKWLHDRGINLYLEDRTTAWLDEQEKPA